MNQLSSEETAEKRRRFEAKILGQFRAARSSATVLRVRVAGPVLISGEIKRSKFELWR